MVLYQRILLIAVLTCSTSLGIAEINPLNTESSSSERLLDLDLSALNQLSVEAQPPRTTLARLNADVIHRSGAKTLSELLEIFMPESSLLNDHTIIMRVNGEALDKPLDEMIHDGHLPELSNIKLIEFICTFHSQHAASNIIAITTF